MEQTTSKRGTFILIGLLILAIFIVGFFWKQNQSLTDVNQELIGDVFNLEELRSDLLNEIDALQADFEDALDSNDSLESIYKENIEELAVKQAEIKKMKNNFAEDAAGMKMEIEQLRSTKKKLSTLVGQLKKENAQLKESNASLVTKVANADAQNKALAFEISELRGINTELEKDRAKLMAVSTRVTNVRLDVTKKGDKPTGSARRTREIDVSFNITNLPEAKKGTHDLYVVIKDAKGIPVKVANPIKAKISPDTGAPPEEIIAQQVLTADLQENYRLKLKISPEKGSLKAGYYRVSVYTNWGLLGGAQFQLK